MKAVIRILFATALLVTSSLSAATVNNVELSYEQGYTIAKIFVEGPVRFSHQSEVAKDGKPYRIIVDVLSATHALGGKVFSEVPACAVKGIRSSQFSVTPENVCRIVFDMVGETIYRAEQQADAVVLYISDGFSQPFTNWSSRSWVSSTKTPASDVPVASSAPAITAMETETPQSAPAPDINATIIGDHLASLQDQNATESDQKDTLSASASDSNEPVAVLDQDVPDAKEREMSAAAKLLLAQSFSAHAASAQNRDESAQPSDSATADTVVVVASDSTSEEPLSDTIVKAHSGSTSVSEEANPVATPDAIPSATEEVVPAPVESQATDIPEAKKIENPEILAPALAESTLVPSESTKVRERASRKKSTPMASLGPDFDFSLSDPNQQESATAQSNTLQSESKSESSMESQPEPAMLADADATILVDQAKPNVESPAPSAKPTAVSESKKSVSEPVKSSAKPVVSGGSKSPVSSGDTMASEKPSPADIAPAVDTASSSQPTPSDDGKAKGTARFRRDPITSKKMRGTLVAEFPQRLVIQYKGKSSRDPFETLVDQEKQFNTPIEKRVPNVEGLTLVGVIETGWGDNRALFEDRSGHGYIMQSGDKVQKGYVLRVEKDRVYFQLFEYGWSRTVSITIEDE